MAAEILEAIIKSVPIFKEIMQEDMDTIVTDTEKVLAYFPGEKIVAPIVVGRELNPKQPTYQAIHSKQVISRVVPREVHGIVFKSVVYPLKDSEGNVIGAVGIGKSMEKQFQVEETAQSLYSSLGQTNVAVAEIAEDSQGLSSSINDIIALTKIAEERLKKTDSILSIVNGISSKTNLLGLNAAIEASRVGEYGRGFNVVASEIRSLSKQVKESTQNISKELDEIKNIVINIIDSIHKVSIISANQASSTEEITATLEELTSTFETLVDISKVE
jgi:hypothetical protein